MAFIAVQSKTVSQKSSSKLKIYNQKNLMSNDCMSSSSQNTPTHTKAYRTHTFSIEIKSLLYLSNFKIALFYIFCMATGTLAVSDPFVKNKINSFFFDIPIIIIMHKHYTNSFFILLQLYITSNTFE